MVREKTVTKPTSRVVRYDSQRWEELRSKRDLARPAMERLAKYAPLVHGSVARGDVTKNSDVDIVIPTSVPSYAVEIALGNEPPIRREVVQATPWHLIKAHIYIEDDLSVTLPLVKPTPIEEQFYLFGGALGLGAMSRGERVPGVDKRLMLIEPLESGHRETSIVGRESLAAKSVGVSLETVKERVDVLSRRDSVGRTGVYLKRVLSPDDSFEDVLRQIASRDPNVKRRV